jgi:hypothetical protein
MLRYLDMWPLIRAYLENLLFGQLGAPTSFAAIRRSVLGSIQLILGTRAPAKIGSRVVRRIAIVMASLLVYLRFTMERTKHQSMDMKLFSAAILVKDNLVVLRCGDQVPKDFPFDPLASHINPVKRANGAIVGHLVKTLKPKNWQPMFFHAQPPIVECAREKLRGNWHGNQLSAANLATQKGF